MILREVQIENFRQITGEHQLKFARPGDRSLTVILGENGSGKTTLLQAFLWCLYGRTDFVNEQELASYHALARAEPGEFVPVRVRMMFDANDRRYLAERSFEVKADASGQRTRSDTEFYVSRTGPDGETASLDDPRQEIKRLLPEELADFFFFQGEDLEGLVAKSGANKLKSSVEEFVDLTLIDRAIRHLDKAESKFEKEVRQQTSGRSKELTDEIRELEEEIREIELKHERKKDEKQELQQQIEDIETKLARYEEIRPLVERKKDLSRRIEALEEELEEKEAELARVISRDGYLRLNPDILNKGARLANEAVERGELPANIKPQFVDDLMEDGECICGRALGERERSLLKEWRSSNELADLENAITSFRHTIEGLERRVNQFESDFERRRDELAETRAKKRELVGQRSNIVSKLEGKNFSLEEDVGKLQKLLSESNDALSNVSMELGRLETHQKSLVEEQEQLLKYRDDALQKEEKAKVTSRRAGTARHVKKAFQKIREGWIHLVQNYLDAELKRNWEEMAQLDRLVAFDESFRLSIHERGAGGEWVESAPSSANQRALALGFVTSLIRLAAEAGAANEDGALFFAGGEYPLVMDAPFATMDTHFKQTVPDGLRKIVPQLVLVNSLDQWTGMVEDVLADAIGRVYVLELHGPEVEQETFDFHGHQVEYKVAEPDAAYDWTVIEEIEV